MCRSDPIRSKGVKIGSRSDTDPEKSDLDPDRGSAIQCITDRGVLLIGLAGAGTSCPAPAKRTVAFMDKEFSLSK